MSPKEVKRKAWFNRGADALRCVLPEIPRSYLCPLCLNAFSEEALDQKLLSLEHVPPKNMGGSELVLTCKPCNERAGSGVDAELKKWQNQLAFARRDMPEARKYRLEINDRTVDALCQWTAKGLTVTDWPQRNSPQADQALTPG